MPTASAFAAAISDVLGDADRRKEKISNAILTVAENTSEISANRLLDTYDRIYDIFESHREMFTAESRKVRFDFAEVVKIAILAVLTYLLQYFDMMPDPAAYFFK